MKVRILEEIYKNKCTIQRASPILSKTTVGKGRDTGYCNTLQIQWQNHKYKNLSSQYCDAI